MKQTTILIVDDVLQVRQELSLLLSLAGPIEVVGEAPDGLAAIAKAEGLHPHVVVLDLEMPGLDGFETCRQIKQRRLAGRVVVLSIHASQEDVQAAAAAGADSFIAKGASLDALLEAILKPEQRKEKPWLPQ